MKPLVGAALLLGCALGALGVPGWAQGPLTILYTSSLNGNLDGCDCPDHPRAGLVKRAAWLHRAPEAAGALLLDCGDTLDVDPDALLGEAILDTYVELGYAAVAVGDQELTEGVHRLLEYGRRYPLLANNLTLCPDENSCLFFSPEPQIVERAGLKVGLFAVIDPEVFLLYPPELTRSLKVGDPALAAASAVQALRQQKVRVVVGLYHGPYENALAMTRAVKGVDVLLVGHEQRLVDARRSGGTIVASPGEEGNRVGILQLRVGRFGRIDFENRFRLLRWAEDPDDPAVRRRIEEYRQRLRGRLSSPGTGPQGPPQGM